MRVNFLRDVKVSQFGLFFDVEILPLSFAPCLTHLFVPPYTDPSTRLHIQEVQVTFRLNVCSVLLSDLLTFCFIFFLSIP